MRIITISREFGSGGRELGKRLADLLNYDYYDKEIIGRIAERKEMDREYLEKALEGRMWRTIPLTFGRTFAISRSYLYGTSLLVEEKRVIEGIANAGNDCIIVGRNANILLQDYFPFNIFVCAEMQAKINRCMERMPEGQHDSEKEIEQKIKRIDKGRKDTRALMTGAAWGAPVSYHLVVNTTDWSIKELAPAVGAFAERFFDRRDK